MNNLKLYVGWAQCSITPNSPVLMVGQMYPRVSRYVHDPITATALALENGENQTILVSMDMTGVPLHAMDLIKEKLSECSEIPFEKISFNVIHTHNSSTFYDDSMRSENIQVYDEEILHLSIPLRI